MTEFEARLEECLEALREGRWNVEECLRRYPQHADALRPHLLVAAALGEAYAATPGEEFAAASRERFLIASGQRLQEAFDHEPSLSFFAAARVKFLMAAQRMKLGEAQAKRRRAPLFGMPFRALAGAGAAMVMFLGFSTYTVASANNALPGDWQYPVKLQTERVRLALAFSESAEHDVQLDIAAERASEIERLSAKGKIIGPGVLDRLVAQTEPLVKAADDGDLDQGELARLRAISEKQRAVLAKAEPQVAPEALTQLDQARDVSEEGAVVAAARLKNPIVVEPVLPLSTEEATATAEPSATPATPEGTPSSETPSATPSPVPTAARNGGLVVEPEPVDVRDGVIWVRLVVDRFSTLIPSEKDGWRLVGVNVDDGPVQSPNLVRLSNADGTSLITINPRNGDMYWFVAVNGVFDEVQMRSTRDGGTFVADPDVLRRLYGSFAEIPLFVLDNIHIEPEPTPTPAPTDTPIP